MGMDTRRKDGGKGRLTWREEGRRESVAASLPTNTIAVVVFIIRPLGTE